MLENKVTAIIYKIIFGLMLISFAYFAYKGLQRTQKSSIQVNEESCQNQKKKQYAGIITESVWSRGSFISILNDEILFKWRCKSKVRDIIEVGDSIYKPSDTFDTYIYKNANPDSIIFVECDFDCDY